MTIIWDDDGNGEIYDGNGDVIGIVDPSESLIYPDDIQSVINAAYIDSDDEQYRDELLLDKIDGNIKRSSKEQEQEQE